MDGHTHTHLYKPVTYLAFCYQFLHKFNSVSYAIQTDGPKIVWSQMNLIFGTLAPNSVLTSALSWEVSNTFALPNFCPQMENRVYRYTYHLHSILNILSTMVTDS